MNYVFPSSKEKLWCKLLFSTLLSLAAPKLKGREGLSDSLRFKHTKRERERETEIELERDRNREREWERDPDDHKNNLWSGQN